MQQITDTILMVRPMHFGFDKETAANNAFQVNDPSLSQVQVETLARQEFDQFVEKLRSVGIEIIVIEDTDSPRKPDAVFPNNWFSTHEDGTLITYPLCPPNRRSERRVDILDQLAEQFQVNKHIRFEYLEKKHQFLEGTGSMILDRPNQLIYACRSARTHEVALDHFSQIVSCQPILFNASDTDNIPIYHTNVMMALGEDFVIIVLEAIKNKLEQQMLLASFAKTNKKVIELTMDQMLSFAGNMLQVRSKQGARFLVMSSQAYQSLRSDQIKLIEQYTQILHSPIPTLEKYGGGSARCMMAEIFLPED
jgi:hypothetical protein